MINIIFIIINITVIITTSDSFSSQNAWVGHSLAVLAPFLAIIQPRGTVILSPAYPDITP